MRISSAFLAVCVMCVAACDQESLAPPNNAPAGRHATVERVTDGDTIRVRVAGQTERVRLIGIDTPETEHSPRGPQPFADEATAALTRLLAQGSVILQTDVEERDRYGRLLAYVYTADGTFVNEEMMRQGWARPLTIPPNVRHADLFARLAQEARRARAGMWR